MVNARGERFLQETEDIAGMVLQVLAQPGGVAWVVYDERVAERCAYIPESQQLEQLRAPRRAETAESLARTMGVDPAVFAAALADAHAAHRSGHADAQGRAWGADAPPTAPYLALRVCGALYHTQGGLQVDAGARVMRPDATPIPRLFAGGGTARGVSGPSSWGYLPAMGLCAAVTLGWLAGRGAAQETHQVSR